jgi:hypothetical protein
VVGDGVSVTTVVVVDGLGVTKDVGEAVGVTNGVSSTVAERGVPAADVGVAKTIVVTASTVSVKMAVGMILCSANSGTRVMVGTF